MDVYRAFAAAMALVQPSAAFVFAYLVSLPVVVPGAPQIRSPEPLRAAIPCDTRRHQQIAEDLMTTITVDSADPARLPLDLYAQLGAPYAEVGSGRGW